MILISLQLLEMRELKNASINGRKRLNDINENLSEQIKG